MILMPLYPSLACVHLPDSQIQRGLSKAQINSKEMYHFSYGLYTALPFLFRHQLFESRLQFQCNKLDFCFPVFRLIFKTTNRVQEGRLRDSLESIPIPGLARN